MSDVVERAKAALEGVTEGPWGTDGELIGSELVVEAPGVTSYKHAIANMETDYYAEEGAEEGETYGDDEPWRPFEQMQADAEFIAQARTLVPELVAEVERLRSYKSLPPGMVWQDYYSPDDVIAIREPLDAEIERLRKVTDIIDPDSVYREQRDQTWAERDAANTEVERLRADLAALQRLVRNPQVVAAIATVDPDNAVEVEIR